MALASSVTEPHLDALSRVNWSEWLIGPCVLAHWLSSDGRVEYLQFQSLIGVLTFKVEPGTLPLPLVELLTTASPAQSNGGS